MNNRVRSLITVVALGIPGVAFADEAEFTAFASSKYTYCDAKVLSALWKQSVTDSKARIGRKVAWKDQSIVDGMLAEARKNATKNPKLRCSFDDAGFTYDDAVKLAKLWKKTELEAKTRVEQKILTGGEAYVHELLGHKKQPTQPTQDDEIAVFASSKYTYCDAKVLSAHWKNSVIDAKALIGAKINFKNIALIDQLLSLARKAATKNPKLRCTFDEAGFTYDDAVKLARMWKKTELEAKTRVEDKILAGNEALVRAMLKGKPPGVMQPPPIKPPPPATKK